MKGQFLLVSAILVSMLLMSTAASMSEIKETNYEPVKKGYHVSNIQEIGQKLDLAKKSNREHFREAIKDMDKYSTQLNYWTQNSCYNMTLSNTRTTTRLTCVGNGSIFHDGFEDGNYRDPAWLKTTSDGQTEVTEIYTPTGGNNALKLTENADGDTSFKIIMQRNTTVWDQPWKADGLFYTENINTNQPQKHSIILAYQNENQPHIKLQIGTTDNNGNDIPLKFAQEGLITNNIDTGNVNWQVNTWYHYQIRHEGTGTYTARIWEEGQPKPGTEMATATGNQLTEEGLAGYRMNGTSASNYIIKHAYFRLRAQ